MPDWAIADVAAATSLPVRGWRTSAAPRRSPRSTRTRGDLACIRSRHSRARAAPSSSTAPGPRSPPRLPRPSRAPSGWRQRSACSPSSSPMAIGSSTTPAPSSRRTISSRSTARRRDCSPTAGAPPAALVPLMRQTIANGFELTGPIERGDTATVEAHIGRDHAAGAGARADVSRPGSDHRAMKILRTVDELRQALEPVRAPRHGRPGADDGRAARGARRAACARRAASATPSSPACSSTRRSSVTQRTWRPIRAMKPTTPGSRRRRRRHPVRARRPTRSIGQATQHGSTSKGRAAGSKGRSGPDTSAASPPSASSSF